MGRRNSNSEALVMAMAAAIDNLLGRHKNLDKSQQLEARSDIVRRVHGQHAMAPFQDDAELADFVDDIGEEMIASILSARHDVAAKRRVRPRDVPATPELISSKAAKDANRVRMYWIGRSVGVTGLLPEDLLSAVDRMDLVPEPPRMSRFDGSPEPRSKYSFADKKAIVRMRLAGLSDSEIVRRARHELPTVYAEMVRSGNTKEPKGLRDDLDRLFFDGIEVVSLLARVAALGVLLLPALMTDALGITWKGLGLRAGTNALRPSVSSQITSGIIIACEHAGIAAAMWAILGSGAQLATVQNRPVATPPHEFRHKKQLPTTTRSEEAPGAKSEDVVLEGRLPPASTPSATEQRVAADAAGDTEEGEEVEYCGIEIGRPEQKDDRFRCRGSNCEKIGTCWPNGSCMHQSPTTTACAAEWPPPGQVACGTEVGLPDDLYLCDMSNSLPVASTCRLAAKCEHGCDAGKKMCNGFPSKCIRGDGTYCGKELGLVWKQIYSCRNGTYQAAAGCVEACYDSGSNMPQAECWEHSLYIP